MMRHAGNHWRWLLAALALVFMSPSPVPADLEVVREVVLTPKKGRAGATIGQVNTSEAVVLETADVDIRPGPLPPPGGPLRLDVSGVFTLKSRSDNTLELTVGFPVSNSRYTAFELRDFTVSTDETPRTVCQRVTGYPRFLQLEHVSGSKDIPCSGMPDYAGEQPGRARHLYGRETMGHESFQNLMVWRETFSPGQTRTVRVDYSITLPEQPNTVEARRVRGNYKNTWPQEANAVPVQFLAGLEKGRGYYFFDYSLTSGASWAGPIGRETVTLHLDPTWAAHTLHRSYGPGVDEERRGDPPLVYAYTLRNAEPHYNLLFALSRREEGGRQPKEAP